MIGERNDVYIHINWDLAGNQRAVYLVISDVESITDDYSAKPVMKCF